MANYCFDLCIDTDVRSFYDTKKNYATDAGFDLYVPDDVTFQPGEMKIVDLKLKVRCRRVSRETTDSNVLSTISYYMYPRSSISKTPLMLANSVGIIDKDYRGNIKAALRHVGRVEDGAYTLDKGTRIVQLTIPTLEPYEIAYVDNLDETARGEGGFGSTGK
jgi:dUTP pyrophosphatase